MIRNWNKRTSRTRTTKKIEQVLNDHYFNIAERSCGRNQLMLQSKVT